MNLTEVGRRLEKRRKEINLRQEDLAEMSGITVKTIYNIEEGKGNPSFKTLSELCNILGLDMIINIKQLN